ncbi:MAG: hypothetical protein ACXABY_33085 [Candidatus Thorarchaeota archaeon]
MHNIFEVLVAILMIAIIWLQRRRIKQLDKDLKWVSKRLWDKETSIFKDGYGGQEGRRRIPNKA